MKKFFKSRSAQVFRGLLIVVLFAKLSNWFLDITDETNLVSSPFVGELLPVRSHFLAVTAPRLKMDRV